MGSFEMSIFVNRSPEYVFDYITNTDNDKKWQDGLVSSAWITPEPQGVDSVKRVITRILGRELEADVKFTTWDRPNGYTFETATGPYTVEGGGKLAEQDGGTMITLGGSVDISGFLGLFEGMIIGRIKKADAANFERLRQLLEAD